jgi:hypothetical protein
MIDNIYIDIAIGLVFTYLLYSLLATAVLELLATFVNLRGKSLFNAVKLMLNDLHLGDQLSQKFFAHPMIKKLSLGDGKRYPSYIDPKMFGRVMEQILPDLYLGSGKPLTLEEKLKLLPDGEFKEIVQVLTGQPGDHFLKGLEIWFNMTMDRLSGMYKRTTQIWLLVIGLVIAVCFNVDSIAVFTKLSTDKEARERVVAQAIRFEQVNKNYDSMYQKIAGISKNSNVPVSDSVKALNDSLLHQFNLQRTAIRNFINSDIKQLNKEAGIGWNIDEKTPGGFLLRLFGWIITALAISIGSPFWFDLLQKLVKLRGSGTKPDEKK